MTTSAVRLRLQSDVTGALVVMAHPYEELRRAIEEGGKIVMDSYGGCDQAEFFAVATECFFEKPKQLCKRHPDLYDALRQFYRQDPAAWVLDPPEDLNAPAAD